MQSSADGDTVIAKLDDGDDLFASIETLAAKHEVENGAIMWAIGMVREVEVGYFNGREYERATFREPMELLGLHGTFAAHAEPKLHLHVTAAGQDHTTVGGHLFRATVAVVNEVCLRRLDRTKLGRAPDATFGLRMLTID